MRVLYSMPNFTEESDARAIGAACGLTLIEFKEMPDGQKAAYFTCETQTQINDMSADLSYGPDAQWKN